MEMILVRTRTFLALFLTLLATSCTKTPACDPSKEFEVCLDGKPKRVKLHEPVGYLRQEGKGEECEVYGEVVFRQKDKGGFMPSHGVKIKFYPRYLEKGQNVLLGPDKEEPLVELEYKAWKPITKGDTIYHRIFTPASSGGSAEIEFSDISDELGGLVAGKIKRAKLIRFLRERKKEELIAAPKQRYLELYNVPFNVVLQKHPTSAVPRCPFRVVQE